MCIEVFIVKMIVLFNGVLEVLNNEFFCCIVE